LGSGSRDPAARIVNDRTWECNPSNGDWPGVSFTPQTTSDTVSRFGRCPLTPLPTASVQTPRWPSLFVRGIHKKRRALSSVQDKRKSRGREAAAKQPGFPRLVSFPPPHMRCDGSGLQLTRPETPCGRDSPKGALTEKAHKRKAAANERLRAAVAPLPATTPVPFLCECSDPECLGRVEMTLDEYGETRASDAPIRLAEHREDTDVSEKGMNGA
jgi:hypothetical protein